MKGEQTILTLMPREIFLHILSYLTWKELRRGYRICSSWKALASTPGIWEKHFDNFFREDPIFKHHTQPNEELIEPMPTKKQKIEANWESLFTTYCRDRITLCYDDENGEIHFSTTQQECKVDYTEKPVMYIGPFITPEVARKMRLMLLNRFPEREPPQFFRGITNGFLSFFECRAPSPNAIFLSSLYLVNLTISICKSRKIHYEWVPVNERSSVNHALIIKSITEMERRREKLQVDSKLFEIEFNSI